MVKYDTIVNGTIHTLEFALKSNCKKFLYISSGATYGTQPKEILHIPESYLGAPSTLDKNFDHSVLGEAKRVSEILTSVYSNRYGLETKIARCFSFVGPYLPLNVHYAIEILLKMQLTIFQSKFLVMVHRFVHICIPLI